MGRNGKQNFPYLTTSRVSFSKDTGQKCDPGHLEKTEVLTCSKQQHHLTFSGVNCFSNGHYKSVKNIKQHDLCVWWSRCSHYNRAQNERVPTSSPEAQYTDIVMSASSKSPGVSYTMLRSFWRKLTSMTWCLQEWVLSCSSGKVYCLLTMLVPLLGTQYSSFSQTQWAPSLLNPGSQQSHWFCQSDSKSEEQRRTVGARTNIKHLHTQCLNWKPTS